MGLMYRELETWWSTLRELISTRLTVSLSPISAKYAQQPTTFLLADCLS